MTHRAIIIDDETPARILLGEMLNAFPDIEVVGQAANGFEALKIIQESKPDLLFLDIQMPKINGFELLEVLDDHYEVIFITAFSEYAIRAFEKNAVDYLIKPVDPDRLRLAIDKAKMRIAQHQPDATKLLPENYLGKHETLERLVVKSGTKIHILPLRSVFRIAAEDDYISIHTADGKFLKKQTMKYLENHLPAEEFVRIHRSHIINISVLEKIEPYSKDHYLAILKNGDKVPISNPGYQALKQKLDF